MASRVVLHIGVQKSGTSYLQYALSRSSDALAAAGLSYPLPRTPRSTTVNHERATYGLLGEEYPWVTAEQGQTHRAAWDKLADEVSSRSGTVLLSAEALSVIRRPAIEALLDGIGVSDVEVVVTVRQLGRLLASSWQQHIRNGRAVGFDGYLGMLAEQRARPAADTETVRELSFWRAIAFGGLVERWAGVVGMERLQVVTSPGSPPELLWARFAEGIRQPGLGSVSPPTVPPASSLSGMTAAEVALLASVNEAVARRGQDAQQSAGLRRQIIRSGFYERPDRGPKVSVPKSWQPEVAQWSAQDVAALEATGVSIIGDLADLAYDPSTESSAQPTEEDMRAAAAAAVLAVYTPPKAHRPRGQRGPKAPRPATSTAPASEPMTAAPAHQLVGRLRRRLSR